MLGNPKYKREQMISFTCELDGEKRKLDGVIYVVDANGTADQQKQPNV